MNNEDSHSTPTLAEFLDSHRGERHIIVLQDFPDPDAISSAYAHRLIAAAFGIECDIVYSGRISHPENIALVKLLGIEMLRFDPSHDWNKIHGCRLRG